MYKKIGGNDEETVVVTPDVLENYSGGSSHMVSETEIGLAKLPDLRGQCWWRIVNH